VAAKINTASKLASKRGFEANKVDWAGIAQQKLHADFNAFHYRPGWLAAISKSGESTSLGI
jgi:hypothetical protein